MYHSRTLNDSTLPPIEVCGKNRIDALMRTGATVWTEAEWQQFLRLKAERGQLIRAIESKPELAHAQQKPAEKPVTYVLNPEAAKLMKALFQDAANEDARHKAELQRINDLQAALMKGAGIPESEWSKRVFKLEPDGSMSFVPKPEPSPKP
jgi:hypothetical protein